MFSVNEWESTADIWWDPMDQVDIESRDFMECVYNILLGGGGKQLTKKQ